MPLDKTILRRKHQGMRPLVEVLTRATECIQPNDAKRGAVIWTGRGMIRSPCATPSEFGSFMAHRYGYKHLLPIYLTGEREVTCQTLSTN